MLMYMFILPLQTYQLLNSDDHANFLRKNGRDPAHYRPDITHQVRNFIVFSSDML